VKRHAFTFVEVLVAVVVMALVVPVAVRGIGIARRLVGDDERLERAARLADEKLNELIVTGDWQGSEDQGVFEDEPQYEWTLATDSFTGNDQLSLTVVTVTVSFIDASRPTSVSLSTLTSSTAEAE
jgi:prepilin-type N-terminal cleavage/methylation domain-containing protein